MQKSHVQSKHLKHADGPVFGRSAEMLGGQLTDNGIGKGGSRKQI